MREEYIIETIEHNGYTVEIWQDTDPESPDSWDLFGTRKTFHRRYDFSSPDAPGGYIEDHGREYDLSDAWDFKDWIETSAARREIVALDLYLYDHSILRLSTGSFIGRAQHAEWDSGLVGFVFATR